MQIGVGLVGEYPPARMVTLARAIESLGFDAIWLTDERFYRDVYATLTLIACHTERVGLGCMVTDPFVRHPALSAVAAATVDEVSGGRFVLGMGAGVSGFHEMGLERVRPARAIREAIEMAHRLTRGERAVTVEGEVLRLRGATLDFAPVRPVQVYVAGRGPRVLQVGGEVADGVVIASHASDVGIRWALDQVTIGAGRSGRSLEDVRKMSWLYTSVSEDGAAARNAVRRGVAVAMWGSRNILRKIGIELPEPVLRFMDERPYRFDAETIAALGALLPDALLDRFSVAGTAREVAVKLAHIETHGMTQAALWVFPPAGEAIEDTLGVLARDVLPELGRRGPG